MDTDCASESGAAHDGDNLDQASVQFCASRHEQEQTAHGTKAAAKSCTIMGYNRDQGGRYPAQRWDVQSDEFQVGWDEDPGHAKECDGETGKNEAECTSS